MSKHFVRPLSGIVCLGLCCGFASVAQGQTAAQSQGPLNVPNADLGILQVEQRAQAQRERAETLPIFHTFTFQDRLASSGITFRHQPPADATSDYKMVHYDHGNGLAVADIDGDERLDLYFVSQMGGNELWRNLGDGTFENITQRSPGLAMVDLVAVGAAFGDIDNDGDPDLYVTTVNMGNRLFENRGRGRFRDITRSSGTGHRAHSSGATFFDYDRDGLLDLFVTNVGRYTSDAKGPGGYYVGLTDAFSGHLFPDRAERSTLYRNLGKAKFEDVTEQTGLIDRTWSGDSSFADVNGDGRSDLYVLNMQGDDSLWIQRENGRFANQTSDFLAKTPWGSMGIKFFDWDNDQDLDLFLTDMHSDMSSTVTPANEHLKSFMTWDDEQLQGGDNNIFGNAFYRQDRTGFVEVSDAIGAENYWPWGVSVGDVNGDGYEDALVISSMNYPFRYVENALLLNVAGQRFERAEYVLGVEPRLGGPTKKWFDMECPPPADLPPPALANIGAMRRQCGFREGTVEVVGTRGSRSAAIIDLDGDGDQDAVISNFHDVPQLLISDLSEKREVNYLLFRLRGTTSNRDGLGATIVVRTKDTREGASGRTLFRHHDGKLGYLAQSSHPVFVGLEPSEIVDEVEVRWPSGKTQTLDSPERNRLVEVVEP